MHPSLTSIDSNATDSKECTEDVLSRSDVEEKCGGKPDLFLHGLNAPMVIPSSGVFRQLQQECSWPCLMCVATPPLLQEDHHHIIRYVNRTGSWHFVTSTWTECTR